MNAIKAHKSILSAWWLPLGVATFVFALVQLLPLIGVYVQQDTPLPAPIYTPEVRPLELVESPDTIPYKFDQSLSATLSIPALHVVIPIVWSQSTQEKDLQNDLSSGAIHYPGTAIPGNIGNALLAAHSSDYAWKKGAYKNAFASLGRLSVGDTGILITYTDKDAMKRTLQFRVTEKAIVAPDDQRIFEEGQTAQITLITCWPVGTNWRRLIVKADVVGSGDDASTAIQTY